MPDLTNHRYRPCVGLMVVNKEGHIFTGQRIGYSAEAWQMPQGGIEKGEEPLVAAYRELKEETSITRSMVELLTISNNWFSYDLPEDLAPKLWNGLFVGQTQKWFLMKFLGEDSDINLATETQEFSSWRWSSRQQLINSIVPFKKELYRKILREFNAYL